MNHPAAIFVQLTTACNARCIHCPHRLTYRNEPRRDMSDEVWSKILHDMVEMEFTGQVGLYLQGEPLLHEPLADRLKQVHRETRAYTVVSTNGSLLDEKRRAALIAARPSVVHIHIPSSDSGQYEQMTTLSFERVVSNVRALVAESGGRLDVRVNCPAIPDTDWSEFETIFPNCPLELHAACSRAGSVSDVYANQHYTRFNTGPFCEQPTQNFCILVDGTVIVCCNDWRQTTRAEFGNVLDSPILDIYNGPAMRRVQAEFCSGDYSRYPICTACAKEMGFACTDDEPTAAAVER